MTHRFISDEKLAALVAELVAGGRRVIAPVGDGGETVGYRAVQRLEDAALGQRLPRHSLKEFFLPATEVLLRYRQTKDGVEIKEVQTTPPQQVILGATPCDVAALEIVDKVMDWDFHDELWFGRREATTIVSLLCAVMDGSCFCTAVRLGPECGRGSDVLLVPVDGGYVAYIATAKGEELLRGYSDEAGEELVGGAEALRTEARRKVEKNLAAIPAEFGGWLAANYGHPVWKTLALRCHGCGACASVCPTCHCFDIVDEHDSSDEGVRRRNWDSCQTSKFTVHASGHNPRASQSERFRQRIEHKFSIYPSRFGEVLCTGCGRCSRTCPAGMDLPELVGGLIALAKAEGSEG